MLKYNYFKNFIPERDACDGMNFIHRNLITTLPCESRNTKNAREHNFNF